MVANEIYDKISNDYLNIGNLPLLFDLLIFDYEKNNYYIDLSDFKLVKRAGDIDYKIISSRLFFETTNQSRNIKLGFIPQKKSYYLFTFDYLRPDYEDYNLMQSKCSDMIKWSYVTNEYKDSLDYYQMPDSIKNDFGIEEHLRSGNFVFRVVD